MVHNPYENDLGHIQVIENHVSQEKCQEMPLTKS